KFSLLHISKILYQCLKFSFIIILNIRSIIMKNKKNVFYSSLAVSLIFIVYGMVFPHQLTNFSEGFLDIIYDNLGWLFLISVLIFIAFCIYIAFSKYGK